ncbi:DUF932 domain-containing protein [Hydrogenophaga sp. NFH-34]|uniref:DUF932 domain-containing protein n=1 Tax=Hydrogenophaga sp. NFH-34 TaxID=2744446 RepID=UPI001F272DB5|nr:DUF932 domain-containing protein [Hydrogenophaga sp. NFH-34]
MAHHLSLFAGTAEMAYAGEKPWHGLGQEVTKGASLEQWLEQAHLQWKYNESVAQFTNGSLHDYPDYKVLYRSDNNRPLSVVSDRYKVVQPKDIVEFFRSLVEREGFEIETMGALKEGRRIWALARTNIENDVIGSDRLKAYVLLITSCDGSLATTAKFTSVRVVCWNTQAIALHDVGESGRAVKVRHNTVFNPDLVKDQMGLIGARAFDTFLGNMRALTKVKMSDNDAQGIVASILPVNPEGIDKTKESRAFRKIMDLFHGAGRGSSMEGVQGTAWGLLNAVTEYTDHHVRARSTENRFDSAMFGTGANLKASAESVLLELA